MNERLEAAGTSNVAAALRRTDWLSCHRSSLPSSFSPCVLLRHAVKAVNDKVAEVNALLDGGGSGAGGAKLGGDDLQALVSRVVSSQLAAVSSKLRSEVDKSVGVAMQTMQVRCSRSEVLSRRLLLLLLLLLLYPLMASACD